MSYNFQKEASKIRVLVADDHDIVRYGICSVIGTSEDIEVISEAGSGTEAIRQYKASRPDVCIIDITMPELNGIETTKSILKINPDARILILTMHINEEYLNQVLNAGANGYLLKNSDRDELLESIRTVFHGEKAFSNTISKLMTERYVRNLKQDADFSKKENVTLTKREREILALIAEGHTSHKISKMLFISPRTVDTHRANLMQKLEIKNTAGLVRFAIKNNLIKQ
ncbi:MAG: response regulator transcription factor [Balneolales bacterium]